MASPKFLFIAFALVLVQAQAHPQVKLRMVDIIKKLVPIAEKTIDSIFDTAGQIFDEASLGIIPFQKNSTEKLDKAVDKALDSFNEKLDTIKAGGSVHTGKVVDCIKGAKLPTKIVVVGLFNRTTACFAPECQDIFEKLAGLHVDLKDIKTKAFAAADKVQDCNGTDSEEIKCLTGVIAEVLLSLRTSPVYIVVYKIIDIIETINSKKRHYKECVPANVEQAKHEAIDTLNSITACAKA